MPKEKTDTADNRRLGDEWVDWDGKNVESTDTDIRVFLGMSFATIIIILGITGLFGWLIYPRLKQAGDFAGTVVNIIYLSFAAILMLWLVLFIWGAITKRPFLSGYIIVPKLVNLLLEISTVIAGLFGISRDRLVNSFLKLHNFFSSSRTEQIPAERLMILLPRCLTKEMNKSLRDIRDKYGLILATAGGGGEARNAIRKFRPGLIIAVACERDLLSGFIDVNPHIPVIGFPNIRPCGPCKNTEVNLEKIEGMVRKHIILPVA